MLFRSMKSKKRQYANLNRIIGVQRHVQQKSSYIIVECYWLMKPEYLAKTINFPHVNDRFYHTKLHRMHISPWREYINNT